MSEAQLITWFTAHPFTHTLAVAVVGSVAAAIKLDRRSFEIARAADPTLLFNWGVALKHYALAGSMAAGTVIGASIVHILSVTT